MKNQPLPDQIRSEDEYEKILEWIDQKFNEKPEPDSPEGLRLLRAIELISEFEDLHYPIPGNA